LTGAPVALLFKNFRREILSGAFRALSTPVGGITDVGLSQRGGRLSLSGELSNESTDFEQQVLTAQGRLLLYLGRTGTLAVPPGSVFSAPFPLSFHLTQIINGIRICLTFSPSGRSEIPG
jgi:hypothetical protein